MTLEEFLLARIAEDEIAARSAAKTHPPAGWTVAYDAETMHTRRHDPARVLAECEAKRRIVQHSERAHELAKVGPSAGDGAWFLACRYLAVPYADHPDYREEWRP
jgi:hypothetical protein